jgi:hypothetical protein
MTDVNQMQALSPLWLHFGRTNAACAMVCRMYHGSLLGLLLLLANCGGESHSFNSDLDPILKK